MSRMNRVNRAVVSLLTILLFLNVFPFASSSRSTGHLTNDSPQFPEPLLVVANTPHDPIAINGDANFSATVLAEGWSGNGSLQDPYVIENYDFTLVGTSPEASINISDTRVHFIIQGCTFDGPAATPSYGIHLENSTDGLILNNMITNFAHGLNVSGGCSNLVVTGNNISYNSYGIWWDDSDYLTITQNHCSHNFFTGIYISGSDNGTISENNCSGNGDHGILLRYFSIYNILTDNICNENTNSGFRLQAAIESIFENNTSNENNLGIWTTGSNDNYIQWNIFANNTAATGITDGVPSIWDYNYWSDYGGSDGNGDGIGDTFYSGMGDIDHFPLMFPPFPVEWVQMPIDQHLEFGSEFEYSISVICPAPYTLWMNDSINFWNDQSGIYSGTTLAVGDYPLAVNATNIYGYLTEAIFTVFVRDTTPPTMTHPQDLSFRVDDDTEYELQWTMSDLSLFTFILFRNGTEITSNDMPMNPVFFTTNIGNLHPGVYNYTMVAEDIWGNVATDMLLVTIRPIPFLEVMLPWFIVGAVALVVVLVVVIVLRKRKST